MTTAVRPLPEHGTYARSVGRPAYGIKGCSCPACSAARSKYQQRRALLNATGRTLMVPAGPATAHLRHLRAEKASWSAICDATGLSGSTISNVLGGRRTVIRRTVATAILRVQLADLFAPWQPVDATGSIRRVHALMAIGHYSYDIATACDVDKSVVVHLTNGHLTSVRADTADKIRAGYEVLYTKPGTSVRNRRRAEREGWHSPIAWDGNIDDPNALPDTDNPPDPELKRNERAEQRRDEIWLLHTARLDDEEIAARLGMSPSTVREIRAELRTGRKRDRGAKQQQEAA